MPGGDLREASCDARVGRETRRDLVAVQPAVDGRKVPAVRPDVLLAHADVRLPMFSYVGDRFDSILHGYATSVASGFMSYGFPVLATATALWVLSSGYAILMGQGATDARTWVWRAGRLLAIDALIGTTAFYTSRLVPAIDGTMYDLAQAMLPNSASIAPMSRSPWGLIDQVQVAINGFAAAIQTDAGTG